MQRRFIIGDHADQWGDYPIYDTSRGRGEIIGSVDQEYLERFERAFRLLEEEDRAKCS